jgi:hypothetical protein
LAEIPQTLVQCEQNEKEDENQELADKYLSELKARFAGSPV